MKRIYTGQIQYQELYRELDAQMEKIMSQGLTITHVDSHQHLHVLPQVWVIVQALMKNMGFTGCVSLTNRISSSCGQQIRSVPWAGMG